MIAALARGTQVTGERVYAEAAGKAARFIRERLAAGKHRLYRRYRDNHSAINAYLDDYAFLVWGLIELYETTLDVDYLEQALAYQESMLEQFWDEKEGGFFFSGRENDTLLVASKDAFDQALPSGNSVGALNLLRLGRMTANTKWEDLAEGAARAFSESLVTHPFVHTQFLAALDFMIGPAREIVIAGNPSFATTQDMIRAVHRSFQPNKVLLLNPGEGEGARLSALAPYISSLASSNGEPTAYICERYACERPIRDARELENRLEPEQEAAQPG
jgi:hypothetical protein